MDVGPSPGVIHGLLLCTGACPGVAAHVAAGLQSGQGQAQGSEAGSGMYPGGRPERRSLRPLWPLSLGLLETSCVCTWAAPDVGPFPLLVPGGSPCERTLLQALEDSREKEAESHSTSPSRQKAEPRAPCKTQHGRQCGKNTAFQREPNVSGRFSRTIKKKTHKWV